MTKKLLSVVLSLAIAFTFSFAAIGTASADTTEATAGETYSIVEGSINWNADYTQVTADFKVIKDGKVTDYLRNVPANTGSYKYTFDGTERDGSNYNRHAGFTHVQAVWSNANRNAVFTGTFQATADADFIDLTNAEVEVIKGDRRVDLTADQYLNEMAEKRFVNDTKSYNDLGGIPLSELEEVKGFTLVRPDYASKVDSKGAEKVEFSINNYTSRENLKVNFLKIALMGKVNYEKYDEGTYDVTVTAASDAAVAAVSGNTEELSGIDTLKELIFVYLKGTDEDFDISDDYGIINSTTVPDAVKIVNDETYTHVGANINGTKQSWDALARYDGTESSYNTAAFTYDGQSHGLVVDNMKGVKVEYAAATINEDGEVETTEAYSETAPSFKDVKVNNRGNAVPYYYAIKVTSTTASIAKPAYFVVEVTVDKKLVVAGFRQDSVEVTLDDDIEAVLDKLMLTKGIVDGDTIDFAYNGIPTAVGTSTVRAANTNTNYWVVNADGVKEADEFVPSIKVIATEAPVAPKSVNKVNAPAQSKIIHIKSAKATKKAYTINLVSTSKSGDEVNYVANNYYKKIKVYSSGKVVIRKGLKKGTYVIKTKAYVKESDDWTSASATKVLRIKVKK